MLIVFSALKNIGSVGPEKQKIYLIILTTGPSTRGGTEAFCPGPQPERGPRRPHEGPLNTCLKDRYTLIEQSDLNTLIEQSQYSLEEQCSKLIDKESHHS